MSVGWTSGNLPPANLFLSLWLIPNSKYSLLNVQKRESAEIILKGLSHEIDFKNVVENGQILALIRAAAGF
jgi:hypothetical protein